MNMMNVSVLFNLLNKLVKIFFATILINSVIQKHECKILFIILLLR